VASCRLGRQGDAVEKGKKRLTMKGLWIYLLIAWTPDGYLKQAYSAQVDSQDTCVLALRKIEKAVIDAGWVVKIATCDRVKGQTI
jgi:hypothetical protein